MDIPHIGEYKKNMKGGFNGLDSLGIKETYIHTSTRKSKKYLSTSLFDRGSKSENKNINHYSLCLYIAVKLYSKYLKDYNLALYVDKSITESDNVNVLRLLKYLTEQDFIDIILVEQELNNINLLDLTNKNTIGLYGAFYRFFIYLRPDVETIIMVDADNLPTERFCDYILNFENEKYETIGIFKPLYYMRKNINGFCIPQILAGMHCIKKRDNTIMNPKIFVQIYNYIDKQYELFKNEFKDICDSNVNIKYSNPFQFGFEENAFTNIVMPYFLKKNVVIYPLFFDFGKGFNFYYNEILVALKPEIQQKMFETLSLNTETSAYLNYCQPDNSYNLYIGIIFTGYVYKCIKNNSDIFINNEKKEEIKKLMSISGFYHIYPSFNLQMNIFEINKIIDDLYNKNYDVRITYKKLPESAHKEFNKDTYSYYKKFTANDVKYNNPIVFLEQGVDYKTKYLKYKSKYIQLKNMSK
jgi:hypothetical protein